VGTTEFRLVGRAGISGTEVDAGAVVAGALVVTGVEVAPVTDAVCQR
jgi:hypothetical protein